MGKWRIGFDDGSGAGKKEDEYYQDDIYIIEELPIEEADEFGRAYKVISSGWGDCCRNGGIQDLEIAQQIVDEHNYLEKYPMVIKNIKEWKGKK